MTLWNYIGYTYPSSVGKGAPTGNKREIAAELRHVAAEANRQGH